MPAPPGFWAQGGGRLWPAVLTPVAALAARATARRVARPGWAAPVPVICCGSVTVGGAGKTTLAIDLLRRLARRGVAAHALLRGYGGRIRGVRRITPSDDPRGAGDEALLLAAVAPTWIGADRAASARAAVAAGAEVLVMDDGLQNPTLRKDLSLLVVDGGFGFGNGRVLPAGPLREPVSAGAARCRAAVLIGDDLCDAERALPPGMPVLRARLRAGPEAAALAGERVLAFAGIARPGKFFASLEETGADVVARLAFPDHHRFTAADWRRVQAEAARRGAALVTTAKDAVRLPPALQARVAVLTVTLEWEDEGRIEALLSELLSATAG